MASIEEQSPSCADGVTDSAESTVPFSDSHFAAIEQMYRSQDHPDLDLGHPSYTQATRQHIPLHHLDIESQPFRILLYPQDCTSLRTNTGIWITIPCKPSGHSPQRAHCMVVTQGSEDIGCEILSPLECIFYYGPGGDVLQLLNKAPILPLHVQSLNQDDIVEEAVEPRKTAALRPGSYKLRVQDNPPVYVVVSTREHSLSYIPRPNVFRLSGTKRASASPTTTITPSSSRPSALAITCPITSIASTSGGQTILLRDTHGAEYSFTRLKTIATTSACQVFEARHSWYGDRVVIVKCLQFADGKSPRHRGETWLHEYQIHKELKFAAIVELYGGDARLETLYLESVNSFSLAQSKWRDSHSAHFLGTPADAKRILADMASALRYLRTMAILHNDIKPSNIVYSRPTGAKLIDFGLATRDDWPLCKGGSPWYIPPEFLSLGERQGPADVWALGIVMLYLMQRMPLPDSQRQAKTWLISEVKAPGDGGVATSAMEDWLLLVREEMRQLREVERDEDEEGWMAGVVQRMLNPMIMDRITAQELAVVVQEHVHR